MGDMPEEGTPYQEGLRSFVLELRWALRHLYDPDALRKSPLISMFGLDPGRDLLALQRILLEEIEALRPKSKLSRQAKPWRVYRALYHRYSEQFSQAEVARTLGLSKRQMHRQENEALQTLAAHLQTRHDLQIAAPTPAPAQPDSGTTAPSQDEELRWLAESMPRDCVPAEEVLQAALGVATSLAQALHVRLELEPDPTLSRVAVQESVVRQAILSLLTAAIHAVPGGHVAIRGRAGRGQVRIEIESSTGSPVEAPVGSVHGENLEMAQRLVALCGGSLEVVAGTSAERPSLTRLTVPGAEEATVLVVEDNADTLRLFERYLAGSHYQFAGTRDPQHVLPLAATLRPQVIVLDVMLSAMDGWEVLGFLREDSDTRDIPVIVCSILPEEPLALALGAAAFIRKPVSQTDFVEAIDHQAGEAPGRRV